jgi:phosphate transport system protein
MTQDEHTLKRFDTELEEIRSHILKMGGLVEIQFKLAMHALFEPNTYIARQVVDQDQQVNRMEIEIDGLCCSAIARHKPTASDLRLIVNATKLIGHLERIGDEAKKIAGIAERRAQQYRLAIPRAVKVNHLTDLIQTMLEDALHSFARHDPLSAKKIIDRNDFLKDGFSTLNQHLIEFMTENPHTISASLENLFIVKAVERIGDHIKYISELVINSSNRYYDAQYQRGLHSNIVEPLVDPVIHRG